MTLVEPMINTVAFHFHEMIWTRGTRRGRQIKQLTAGYVQDQALAH